MGRQKANLRTRSKSVTLEKAFSQDVDEVGEQEMHKASTQGMSFLLNSLPFIHKVWACKLILCCGLFRVFRFFKLYIAERLLNSPS